MPAAWWLRVVPSVSVHAAAVAIVIFGGDLLHRAHVVPEDHHVIAVATMSAWLPPAGLESPGTVVPEHQEPVVVKHLPEVVPAETRVHPKLAETALARPEPQPAPFDPLAFVPAPSAPPASPAPSDDNVSVLFVGIENGEWLRWLGERHGFIGFTTRRDDVIEHVYSVSGDLQSTSSVAVANLWALELTQPERVTAIAGMLARERERAGDPDGRIRVFALFPASFREEVAAAIRRAGGTGGFLVSFSGNELQVTASTPASQPAH